MESVSCSGQMEEPNLKVNSSAINHMEEVERSSQMVNTILETLSMVKLMDMVYSKI